MVLYGIMASDSSPLKWTYLLFSAAMLDNYSCAAVKCICSPTGHLPCPAVVPRLQALSLVVYVSTEKEEEEQGLSKQLA